VTSDIDTYRLSRDCVLFAHENRLPVASIVSITSGNVAAAELGVLDALTHLDVDADVQLSPPDSGALFQLRVVFP
jgi:hypothetical protein